ncbi:AAA family ATPase [Paenibacillus kandeliae]|uniref:AAA family ATPase n=1 Tax=Paenibacillus kandeliae TaxID=3231269 RepID=UPI003458539D
MIIMINGAFGTGKTTTAKLLQQRIPNSMIYDPEEPGDLLRRIIPATILHPQEQTGDFQDIVIWKYLVVDIAGHLLRQYGKHLIVPMTLYKREYYEYIHNGLQQLSPDIAHFCLLADQDTIHQRLRQRGEVVGSWAFQQTEYCLAAYEQYDFSEYVDTQHRTEEQVAEYIYAQWQKSVLERNP